MTAPPPPPPHGASSAGGTGPPKGKNGLPDGPYDIFIVPPHSSGGGFIYFPSLRPQRNSFLAGVACTLTVVIIWSIIIPAIRDWMSSIAAGNGFSVIILLGGAGVGGWAWGKTQLESPGATSKEPAPEASATGGPRPQPSWQRGAAGAAKGSWEKAREETRRKEEERKRTEDLKKKREADERERVWQREKETRERETRERRDRENGGSRSASPNKSHLHPTAKTATSGDDASSYSFRPYDNPEKPTAPKSTSASSIYSESSYAPSHSTSRTTPPPTSSNRVPYKTKDPDKIVIKGVYSFNSAFFKTPLAKLVSGAGSVTDGLILRITTEGLFIDDDVRGVPQREWDIKAWTLKLVESGEYQGMHVLRASIRDAEGKRFVVVLQEEEGWKVAIGLQRLRRGSQVRALGVSGLPLIETKAILESMGWLS